MLSRTYPAGTHYEIQKKKHTNTLTLTHTHKYPFTHTHTHTGHTLVSQSDSISWIFRFKHSKKKVKCNLVQTLRLCTGRTANRGSRGIALLFLDHGTRRSEGSTSRPGRSLPSGKNRHLLYRRLGGPQGRSGQVRKISSPPEFDPGTVQPVTSRYTD